MWKPTFTALLTVLLVLTFAGPASAQGLKVGVYGPDGKPVENVRIHVSSIETGQEYWGLTGADGMARIKVPHNDHYQVSMFPGTGGSARDYASPRDKRGGRVIFNTRATTSHAATASAVASMGTIAEQALRGGRNQEGERLALTLEQVRAESTVGAARLREMEDGVVENILFTLPKEQRTALKTELDGAKSAAEKQQIAARARARAQKEFDGIQKVTKLDEKTKANYRNGINAIGRLENFYGRINFEDERGKEANEALNKLKPLRAAATDKQSAVPAGQNRGGTNLEYTVVNDRGDPLIGANILATHTETGRVAGKTTDLSGKATLRLPLAGEWKIEVRYTGYEATEQTIVVPQGSGAVRAPGRRVPLNRSEAGNPLFSSRSQTDRKYNVPRVGYPGGFFVRMDGAAERTLPPSVPFGPLFQGGNPTGGALLDLNTNTTGGLVRVGAGWNAPSVNRFFDIPFQAVLEVTGEFSKGSTSANFGQVQIPPGQVANLFTVDGANVFNLNNLQNFSFDYERRYHRVYGEVRARALVSGSLAFDAALLLGYRGVDTSATINFQNFNVPNTINTKLDYKGFELGFRAGPTWRITPNLDFSVIGKIGALFLDAKLNANQRVGNLSFNANVSDKKTSLIAGATARIDWRPWGLGHTSLGAFVTYEYANNIPFARYPTALNQPTTIGYGSQDRVIAGVNVTIPFRDMEALALAFGEAAESWW